MNPLPNLGLVCVTHGPEVRYKVLTRSRFLAMNRPERLDKLRALYQNNLAVLYGALAFCRSRRIQLYRATSDLFPHGEDEEGRQVLKELADQMAPFGELAQRLGIRVVLHPDQFVVLNSVRPEVVNSAIGELRWQAEIATTVGADVLCLHGGSTAGGWDAAVDRLIAGVERLSPTVRSLLALENDDRCFPLVELLPVSLATSVPLVLDAHHHRVIDGGLTLAEATDWALATWDDREPYFHISSPKAGWSGGDPRPHADFIAPADVPRYWLELGARLTVDVEAKAKERAVLQLIEAFPG